MYRTAPATANAGTMAAGTANTGAVNRGNEQVLQLAEEEMAVGKRQVQRGGARVHTTVTERPVEERVTLHEEPVTVEHRPVDHD